MNGEKRVGRLRTPANVILHSLRQVNDALAHGRFFFMDIARDGIMPYERPSNIDACGTASLPPNPNPRTRPALR